MPLAACLNGSAVCPLVWVLDGLAGRSRQRQRRDQQENTQESSRRGFLAAAHALVFLLLVAAGLHGFHGRLSQASLKRLNISSILSALLVEFALNETKARSVSLSRAFKFSGILANSFEGMSVL